ncbi:hypothetical protein [Novosphingobium resinovorum]|uniref:hypothetical protein n=1 Tax=Novosphingobium resinovorum TaxID=158500 RepID=UPI002ED554AF|nr:hypothetical protein [Novosphingobium resinovorum]
MVFALGCCTYLIGKDGSDSTDPETSAPTAEAEASATPAVELTKLQTSVVSTMRLAIMRTMDCQWSAKLAQSEIDKAAAGRSRGIDAYEEAKRGLKACSDAMDELGRTDLLDELPLKDRQLEKEALASCRKAAAGRHDAMRLAMQIIDGDDSMANASDYREKLAKASNDEAFCRMNFLGVAENAKIPDSEVEFAQIKAQAPS